MQGVAARHGRWPLRSNAYRSPTMTASLRGPARRAGCWGRDRARRTANSASLPYYARPREVSTGTCSATGHVQPRVGAGPARVQPLALHHPPSQPCRDRLHLPVGQRRRLRIAHMLDRPDGHLAHVCEAPLGDGGDGVGDDLDRGAGNGVAARSDSSVCLDTIRDVFGVLVGERQPAGPPDKPGRGTRGRPGSSMTPNRDAGWGSRA